MTEREISTRSALCNFLTNYMTDDKAELAAHRAYYVRAQNKPLRIIQCKTNGILLVAKSCEQPNKRIVLGVSTGDDVYGVYDTNTKKLDKLSLAGYFAMLRSRDF